MRGTLRDRDNRCQKVNISILQFWALRNNEIYYYKLFSLILHHWVSCGDLQKNCQFLLVQR